MQSSFTWDLLYWVISCGSRTRNQVRESMLIIWSVPVAALYNVRSLCSAPLSSQWKSVWITHDCSLVKLAPSPWDGAVKNDVLNSNSALRASWVIHDSTATKSRTENLMTQKWAFNQASNFRHRAHLYRLGWKSLGSTLESLCGWFGCRTCWRVAESVSSSSSRSKSCLRSSCVIPLSLCNFFSRAWKRTKDSA